MGYSEYILALLMKLPWCNFELHTKGEYEKSFKRDTWPHLVGLY